LKGFSFDLLMVPVLVMVSSEAGALKNSQITWS